MVRTVTNVYMICGFSAIGGGLFGFDISSVSGVLGTQAYKRYFGNPVSYRQGGITCAMPAGSFVGALGSSFIADRFSRKYAIQFASLLWLLGSTIQCTCNGIPMLIVGRIINGFCVGIASSTVPVYQSEVAPKEIRGRVVTLQQWAITWGILIQYFVQYGASWIDGGPNNPNQSTAAFRIPWGIQIIPGLILFVGLFFLPKSPRWLASKDRWEEAIEVLAMLHGGGDINNPKVLAEYQEIEEALRFEREEAYSSIKAITERRMLRRIILGMSIQMWSQLSGVNFMMYYVVYIMEGTNLGSPLLTSSIQYIINVVFTLPAILYIDKYGRRFSLLIGALFMSLFLFISGTLQALYGEVNTKLTQTSQNGDITWIVLDNRPVSIAIIILSYLFVATFAVSWGPSSWTYPAEIFPTKIRAKAVSLSTASNWGFNCALAFSIPPLLWIINWKVYMIFATFNALAFIHVYLAAPETKGRTLEEMEVVFSSGRKAWHKIDASSRLDCLTREIEERNIAVAERNKKGKEKSVSTSHDEYVA